jgi:DeoR family transcriptional regulator, fructose operon transcriptional repressor
MWVHERHSRILSLLQERQRLSTDDCAEALGVSKETIRRDLIELEDAGKLARVHGGAIPLALQELSPAVQDLPLEPAYRDRAQLNAAQKLAIAKQAAQLIEPGMACFIDAGSTTHALARELTKRSGIHIVTNSLEVAFALARQEGIDVMLLGGRMSSDVPATFGEVTIAEISRMQLDLVLFSPVAIHAERGAMDQVMSEAAVARAMVAHADRRILLADGSKLGSASRVQICSAAVIDMLVTDDGADPAACRKLQDAGISQVLRAA